MRIWFQQATNLMNKLFLFCASKKLQHSCPLVIISWLTSQIFSIIIRKKHTSGVTHINCWWLSTWIVFCKLKKGRSANILLSNLDNFKKCDFLQPEKIEKQAYICFANKNSPKVSNVILAYWPSIPTTDKLYHNIKSRGNKLALRISKISTQSGR